MIASNTRTLSGPRFMCRDLGKVGAKDFSLVGVSDWNAGRREEFELHDPKIISAGVRCVDLNDNLGLAVAVNVPDAD